MICSLVFISEILRNIEILLLKCYNTPKPIDIIRRGQSRVITADNILITRTLIAGIIWISQIIRITGIHIL